MAVNEFSTKWYATFAETIPEVSTSAEIAFLSRHLPLQLFPCILDLGCGTGRHAEPLSRAGYEVVGIDQNAEALALARERAPGATFIEMDFRDLASLNATFDSAINLWHSFGYFDEKSNRALLAAVRGILRPGGRVVIDLYNRLYFQRLPREESGEKGGETIHTRRSWDGRRLHVEVEYGSGGSDAFEWLLYDPSEFRLLVSDLEMEESLSCAWFDETIAISEEHARMQFVLERPR
ncbi:MAG: methyltransferase domain-containing protein [Acidobacteria bacterium]|nr:methyltransferase domain-containing protein [Acidobacteriota bacterium]